MSRLVSRSHKFHRRLPHFVDPADRTVTRTVVYGGGSFPWWRTWARITTYGTAYLPRWAERA